MGLPDAIERVDEKLLETSLLERPVLERGADSGLAELKLVLERDADPLLGLRPESVEGGPLLGEPIDDRDDEDVQNPNCDWQPSPQYAFVDPQKPY